MNAIFMKLLEELEKNDVILATVIEQEGSSSRGVGAQMLVGPNGRIVGTVGGGTVEWNSEQRAMELLKERRSEELRFTLKSEAEEGMTCGSGATVGLQYVDASLPFWKEFSERLLTLVATHKGGWLVLNRDDSLPALVSADGKLLKGEISAEKHCDIPLPIQEQVILFGGGHCAQALVPILSKVGFRVTVMENRPELAKKELFPEADQIICGDYHHIYEYVQVAPSDFVVIMTNGHDHDLEVQQQILEYPPAYIGVIGSKSKKASANQRLLESGISEELIQSIHCPIGTAIKAVTPEEIAISIAGEMIYERAMLREKYGAKRHGCPMH